MATSTSSSSHGGESSLAETSPKVPEQSHVVNVAAQDRFNAEASLFPTHDTSKIGWHMRGLEAFAKNVEAVCYLLSSEMDMYSSHLGCALVLSKPWNFSLSFCECCHDAVMHWEHDTLGVDPEFNKLGDVFEFQYGFHKENWEIRANAKSHNLLMSQALSFINDFDPKDNLFILYYAGHGYINAHRQSTWAL
jgi:hypothetical protein